MRQGDRDLVACGIDETANESPLQGGCYSSALIRAAKERERPNLSELGAGQALRVCYRFPVYREQTLAENVECDALQPFSHRTGRRE